MAGFQVPAQSSSVGARGRTNCRQFPLSRAAASASPHDKPISFKSFSTVLLQVIRGRPLFLFHLMASISWPLLAPCCSPCGVHAQAASVFSLSLFLQWILYLRVLEELDSIQCWARRFCRFSEDRCFEKFPVSLDPFRLLAMFQIRKVGLTGRCS